VNSLAGENRTGGIRVSNGLATGGVIRTHVAIVGYLGTASHFLHAHLMKQRHAIHGGGSAESDEHNRNKSELETAPSHPSRLLPMSFNLQSASQKMGMFPPVQFVKMY
jgi:hypothetical protein